MANKAYTYCMRIKKITLKTDRAMLHKPEAKPSIPSIKLIAFVIYTTIKTVTGIPTQAGTEYTPNKPPKEPNQLPDSTNNNADTIWTANL